MSAHAIAVFEHRPKAVGPLDLSGVTSAELAPAETDDEIISRLLSPLQRLKYRAIPPRIYAWARARRIWGRGETELRLLPFLVDSHRNSVDVGANKGIYTWFLARASRHVYAYEPNPAMHWVLKRLSPRNVTVMQRALSDQGGTATLQICRQGRRFSNNTGTLRASNVPEDCETIRVRQSCLDEERLSDIGFLKIDVEGLEQEVLRGGAELIRRDRPVILCEIIEDHTGRPVEESIDFVEQLGYRTLVIHERRLTDWKIARREREAAMRRRIPVPRLRNYLFLPES